ncbi:phosphofructokinase [Mycobacterium phage Doom]|uniref:DUF6378 domain-containing protein n=1 Tax=Mycobacterium phage Doom TaxID=2922222 RepID=G1EV19_9CAUD|nr:phosphofructokinase [Mycobacterium phage Doom]AEJ93642.1 hypothetical protein DOOM_52 [Mycobacterium phage Doom]
MTESILEEARRLIHGPRNKNYGHPRENFADISALFSAYLERPITDLDVANLMILVKVARVKGTGYHRDSYTDIAGYAGCAERIYEEPVEEDGQLALFDFPLPDDLIRNEEHDSLSWVDALNDIAIDLDEDEKPEPRVWRSWTSVPEGVVVTDKDGDTYRRGQGGSWEFLLNYDPSEWEESYVPVGDRNLYAPFTEVVRVSDYHEIYREVETPQSGMHLYIDLDTVTYTSVTNAINALDDVYRSVRAELSLLAEKGTK